MSNALSRKRGKLDRPAICTASPEPPVPPAVVASHWAVGWVTPHVGYCSDFLLRCRAWSHLISSQAPVDVAPDAIDWGTIESTGIVLHNDNIQRATHRLTKVKHGSHQLPIVFTWASGFPLEHTTHAIVHVTQNCPSPILINLAAYVWNWASSPRVSLYAQAWWPNRPDMPTFDLQVETQPNDRFADRPDEMNACGVRWRDWFTIPYEANYTFTLRTWWPSADAPSPITTEDSLTVHLPSQRGYVWASPYTRSGEPADRIWLWGAADEELNGYGVPLTLRVTTSNANWHPIDDWYPNTPEPNWLGYFDNLTPGVVEYAIDATWPDGYTANWASKIVPPVTTV